jgi:hypothetical protein
MDKDYSCQKWGPFADNLISSAIDSIRLGGTRYISEYLWRS